MRGRPPVSALRQAACLAVLVVSGFTLGFFMSGYPMDVGPTSGHQAMAPPSREGAAAIPSRASTPPDGSGSPADPPKPPRAATPAGPARVRPAPVLSQRRLKALLGRRRVLSSMPASKARCIALTLDDGPSEDTRATLAILRKMGVHATFFVIGRQARKRPGDVARMRRDGHEVENHTFSHELGGEFSPHRFATTSRRHQADELRKADSVLGTTTHFLRVPGGLFPFDRQTQTLDVARSLGKVVVNWDVEGDTPGLAHIHKGRIDHKKPEDILRLYLARTRPGSIVLMHPEHRAHAPYTLRIMGPFIREMKKRGYTFVTLEELVMGVGPRRTLAGGGDRPGGGSASLPSARGGP